MNNLRIKLKKLLFLKVTAYHPQVIAPMETRLDNGILESVGRIVDQGVAIESKLNVELCNTITHNISKGHISKIVNGWNTERFTFLLVTEIYDGTVLIAEEMYQGYTSDAEVSGGVIERGGTVGLNPNMTMYVNKVMTISYRTDSFGNRTPVLHRPSNVFVNSVEPSVHRSGLVLNRPSDLIMKYYTDEISTIGNGSMDVRSDTSNYNGLAKLSNTSNETAGTVVTSLVKAADQARRQSQYMFSSADNLSNYEGMLDAQPDDAISNYYTLRAVGDRYSRIGVSHFTVDELGKMFCSDFRPHVATLESHNDLITRNTNQVFNFTNSHDKGYDTTNDNQVTRFQKKVIPFIFDKMLTYGYLAFSGILSNRNKNNTLFIRHSVLTNVSETVNNDTRIYNDMMRMLYESLTSQEAVRLINGGVIHSQDVEIVFDLSIFNSTVKINVNGNTEIIRIPSLSDSLISSTISTEANSMNLSRDLKAVVENVIKVSDSARPSGRANINIWEQ